MVTIWPREIFFQMTKCSCVCKVARIQSANIVFSDECSTVATLLWPIVGMVNLYIYILETFCGCVFITIKTNHPSTELFRGMHTC